MERMPRFVLFIAVVLSSFIFMPYEAAASGEQIQEQQNPSSQKAQISVADKNAEISTTYVENDPVQSTEDISFPGVVASDIHKDPSSISPVQQVFAAQNNMPAIAEIIARDHTSPVAAFVARSNTPTIASEPIQNQQSPVAELAAQHQPSQSTDMAEAEKVQAIADIGLAIVESQEPLPGFAGKEHTLAERAP